jgi:outer membrane immunogenic protein
MKANTGLGAVKLVAGAAIFAFAGFASAAALDGPYIGINAGWSWAKADTEHSLQGANGCGQPLTCSRQLNAVASLPSDMSLNGFTGGAQAGYNWSSGKVVYGFEFDFNWLGQSKSQTSVVQYQNANNNNLRTLTSMDSADSSWLVTIRPRLGFMATEKTLVFATAGLAFGNPKVGNSTTIFNPNSGLFQGLYSLPASKQIQTGWVLGAGVEYAWSNTMSLKGEYQYVNFDNPTLYGPNNSPQNFGELVGSTFVLNSSTKTNILRVGLNWKF